jgi:predicted O-linked N-acetylglucosamine transferase (SPINDLY family)
MLTIAGAPELIARDVEDYVRLAVSLAADDARRAELRQRLLANSSRLFENRAAAAHLQDFLMTTVRSKD